VPEQTAHIGENHVTTFIPDSASAQADGPTADDVFEDWFGDEDGIAYPETEAAPVEKPQSPFEIEKAKGAEDRAFCLRHVHDILPEGHMHFYAAELIQAGLRAFTVHAGAKEASTWQFHDNCVTDPKWVKKTWEWPFKCRHNIGIDTTWLLVIDLDTKGSTVAERGQMLEEVLGNKLRRHGASEPPRAARI
jgi:hypothetical protein